MTHTADTAREQGLSAQGCCIDADVGMCLQGVPAAVHTCLLQI